MAYPTPTIYDYRVLVTPSTPNSSLAVGTTPAYYQAQFSTDSGSTWRPLNGLIYQSLTEAYNQIGFVVSDETGFQTRFEAGGSNVPAAQTVSAYPPA
jgi:hypothetical protein